MTFDLTPEQLGFRDRLRRLAADVVAPGAGQRDQEQRFPTEVITRLAGEGLLGVTVPVACGGLGLDPLSFALAIEEVARQDGSVALILASHNSLACGHLLLAGTPEQQRRWLPELASGRRLGAWALAEAESGSDAAAMKTQAERATGGWRLNGVKMFVTQGTTAGLYIVLARTAAEAKKPHGISAFLLEAGTPGLQPGRPLSKFGCRASDTATLVLRDVVVPEENLLGREGEGFFAAKQLLDHGRIGIAAMAVGLARACLEDAVGYAGKRQQFGQPLGKFQAIQWMLADMGTELEAARLLVHRAAVLQGAGRPCSRESAMAKLFASEAASRAANKALQIHGGYGYLSSLPVERYLRDAKLCEIGEGTSEIQRMVIAKSILNS
ncbi:MAG: acyl-CoA dehydrogenase family protein [Desulfuromonadales bacterium]|nr:acyl-CoA dehydrogenase family protein [Desulfuromonadales bacterium]